MFKGLRYSQGEFANHEHSGHYMYCQFNIQQFYVLPTQCIYVFCVDLRTNSDYFPIHLQHAYFWHFVYCEVRSKMLNQFLKDQKAVSKFLWFFVCLSRGSVAPEFSFALRCLTVQPLQLCISPRSKCSLQLAVCTSWPQNLAPPCALNCLQPTAFSRRTSGHCPGTLKPSILSVRH